MKRQRQLTLDSLQTVLGMNSFFEMDKSNNLVISPQFWIWVVIAIPLTAITVTYWWIRNRRSMARRHRETKEHGLIYDV